MVIQICGIELELGSFSKERMFTKLKGGIIGEKLFKAKNKSESLTRVEAIIYSGSYSLDVAFQR